MLKGHSLRFVQYGVVLLGSGLLAGCAPANRASPRLGISPGGHYITYGAKPLCLIGDSGTQVVTQNANVDYRAWIDDCATRGLTAVQVWAFVPPRQKQDGSVIEKRYGYVYPGLTPWVRRTSGPDAADQLKQWDLRTFDEGAEGDARHYWPRLRDLCRRAKARGLIVGITVFFGWPKYQSDWLYHPFNEINGGPLRDSANPVRRLQMIASPGTEILQEEWSDDWAPERKNQWLWERLCQKYIDDLNGLGNVFFIFMDEHSYREGNCGDHFLQFFTKRGAVWVDWERRRPAVTWVMSDTFNDPDKNANAVRGFNGTPVKPYLHLEGEPYHNEGVRLSLWSFITGGGHYILHDDEAQESRAMGIMSYDPRVCPGPRDSTKLDYLGHASRLLNEHVRDLDALAPHDELVSKGHHCLANPGHEYVIYAPAGSPATIEVKLPHPVKAITWRFYDPRDGHFGPVFRSTSTVASLVRPDGRDWVLYGVNR